MKTGKSLISMTICAHAHAQQAVAAYPPRGELHFTFLMQIDAVLQPASRYQPVTLLNCLIANESNSLIRVFYFCLVGWSGTRCRSYNWVCVWRTTVKRSIKSNEYRRLSFVFLPKLSHFVRRICLHA